MRKVILGLVAVMAMTGCTGVLTGHKYSMDDIEKAKEMYSDASEKYNKVKAEYNVIKEERERLRKLGFDVNTTSASTGMKNRLDSNSTAPGK